MPPTSAFAAYKQIKIKTKKAPNKKNIKFKSKQKDKNKSKGKPKQEQNGYTDKTKTTKSSNDAEKSSLKKKEVPLSYEEFITTALDGSEETPSTDESEEVKMRVKGPSLPSKKKRTRSDSNETTSPKKQKTQKIDKDQQGNKNKIHIIQNILVKNHNSKSSSGSTVLEVMRSTVSKENIYKFAPPNYSTENVKSDSIREGEGFLRWIINPITVKDFFSLYWEENTLLIKREKPNYFSSLISFKEIDRMLLNHHVEFTKNIDVTTYENGVRETHNPEGRALPPAVWDFYREGCSVRLLNPQTFLKPLHELCATLQEYFHCLVGANAYLTPPNSQGFAPHYDDIEAFVLQIEGRKRWKVYSPRNVSEMLPRYSSKNFSQDEIGEPILDQVLEPGDLLYFPRGAIHQASTEYGYHSLHITLSVYQKQSYADLLEKMLPAILKSAIDNNVNLRRGLPLNIWHNAGLVYNDVDTRERAFLKRKVTKIVGECLQSVQLTEVMDAAVDELAKKFQHEALPPFLKETEKPHTIFGLHNEPNFSGDCPSSCPIELRTNIRLLRGNILRLVSEENQIRIYYYLDNSMEYCQYEPNYFEIESELAGSIEILVKSYPEYIGVSQLPLDNDDNKLELATCLWKRGLVMIEKPIRN